MSKGICHSHSFADGAIPGSTPVLQDPQASLGMTWGLRGQQKPKSTGRTKDGQTVRQKE